MLIHPVGICHWCVFMAAALRVLMHFYTTGKKTKSWDLWCRCERNAASRGSCRWVPIVRRSQSHSCRRYVWITANYLKLPLSLACIQWLLNTNWTVSAVSRRQECPPLHSCAALQARDVKLLIESLGNRNVATSSSLIVCAWTMSDCLGNQLLPILLSSTSGFLWGHTVSDTSVMEKPMWTHNKHVTAPDLQVQSGMMGEIIHFKGIPCSANATKKQ